MTNRLLKALGIMIKLKKLPSKAIDDASALGFRGEIVYYAEYSDGCYYIESSGGDSKWNGKTHAPHTSFYPDDIPVKVWTATNESLNATEEKK
jgi:hypothetical protein